MRIRLAITVLLAVLFQASFARCEERVELTVFAAASLTESFKEIGKQFEEKHPNTAVTFNFGASNALRFQIEQGAKADIFASANTKEMDALVKSDGAASDAVHPFARNRLVVLFPTANPGKLTALEELAKPGLKLVIAGKAVPVGNYTLQMLDKMSADAKYGANYKANVLKNVVSEEDNVKSVVAKIRLGQADAGIAYVSDIGAAAREVGALEIPDAFNPIAVYPMAALKKSAQAALAKEFVDYVVSPAGQDLIQKYGFMPVKDAK